MIPCQARSDSPANPRAAPVTKARIGSSLVLLLALGGKLHLRVAFTLLLFEGSTIAAR